MLSLLAMLSLLMMLSLLIGPRLLKARTTGHVVPTHRACHALRRASQSHLRRAHLRVRLARRFRRRPVSAVVDQRLQAALVADAQASPALLAEAAHQVLAALLLVAVRLVPVAVAPAVQEVAVTTGVRLVAVVVDVAVPSKSCVQSTFRPTPQQVHRFRQERSSSNVMAALKM